MPRSRLAERRLPPAVITDSLLRLIDEAIPEPLQGHKIWYVNLGDDAVHERDMESLISEIKKETRFNEVTLEISNDDDPDHWFSFWCHADAAGVSYNIPASRDTHFRTLADTIEKEFKHNKRFLSALRRSPEFRLGNVTAPLLSKLDWTRVTEDMVARAGAHVISLVVGFVLGLAAGWLLGG